MKQPLFFEELARAFGEPTNYMVMDGRVVTADWYRGDWSIFYTSRQGEGSHRLDLKIIKSSFVSVEDETATLGPVIDRFKATCKSLFEDLAVLSRVGPDYAV